MKKTILAIIMLATISFGAHAQQKTTFEPYTVSEQEHNAMLSYLGEVPAKYSNPIGGMLMKMEQAAVEKKAEAEKPKPPKK